MKKLKPPHLFIFLFCLLSLSVTGQDQTILTKSELLDRIHLVEVDVYEAEIYSGLLSSEVKVVIQTCNIDTLIISDCLLQRINDFIVYDGKEMDQVITDVFSDYQYHITESTYGMVSQELIEKHNNNYQKANQEYFNIYTKEEAFEALGFQYASFIDCASVCDLNKSMRYYSLVFKRPWDEENTMEIEFEMGRYKELF